MKPRTLMMMGLAVVCGIAASYLSWKLSAKNQEKVTILVAKEKMPLYMVIRNPDEKFKEETILVNDAPKNVVLWDKRDEVKDRMLKRPIEEGNSLSFDDLLPKDKTSLEAQIKKGHRAWAVKVTAETSAGGFVLPGSHVDVIHVAREGGNRNAQAKTILENVQVVAMGIASVRPEDRPGMIEATATLELTPEQILDLAQVQNNGTLMLSLRAQGDDEKSTGDKPSGTKDKDPLPPPPPPTAEDGKPQTQPAVTTTEATPEPVTITKVMTIYNGASWVQRIYTLDKKTGEVIKSEMGQQREAAKPEATPEAKPAPTETKADKTDEKSTN